MNKPVKPAKKRMGRPSSSHELTAKQARFVALYLADPALNAQHAAMAAGYAPTTAAARLMNRPPVQAAIAKGMQARSDRTQITQDDVLKELMVIMTSDVRNFEVDADGDLILREGVPDHAWRAVQSVKRRTTVGVGGTTHEIEVRLWDKTAATKQAGEHLGMYIKKHELTVPEGGGVLAVPMPIDAAQWGEIAAAQQRQLTARAPVKVVT